MHAFESARVSLKAGRSVELLALARTAAFLDAPLFLREARRQGIFRSSKLGFHSEPIHHVVTSLIADGPAIGWSAEELVYLTSVRELLSLGPAVRATRRELVRELTARREVVVKSCMVCVDRAFRPSIDHMPSEAEQMAQVSGQPEYFHPNQKAAGLSTIVALMEEVVGWSKTTTVLIDEKGIKDGVFENLLALAARLGEFTNAEVSLDAFPYRAERLNQKSKTVMLSAIDDRFEKSVQLGYVHANAHSRMAQQYDGPDVNHLYSLRDAAVRMHKARGHEFIEKVAKPLERYVLRLPLVPPLLNMLKSDELFKEEILYLRRLAREAYLDGEMICGMQIVPGLTVMDLIKVQRFVTFTSVVFFQTLDEPTFESDRDELDMRSRIPAFAKARLREVWVEIFGAEVANLALGILTFDPKKGGNFDIQYRPLLLIDDYYLMPMSIVSASDMIRNSLYLNSVKLTPLDGHDPMVRSMKSALVNQGFCVQEGVNGTFNNIKIEIDILAYRDGVLLVLEAKNSFHPCSIQEMRTSYDHIKKAGRQLSRLRTWLAASKARAEIFNRLKWDVDQNVQIRTGIVTANRIFNGYDIEGHPVRQAHEFLNILGEGIMTFTDGERYQMWRETAFQIHDLVDYLDGKTIINDCFDAMTEAYSTIAFHSGDKLSLKTFGIDFEQVRLRVQDRHERLPNALSTSL